MKYQSTSFKHVSFTVASAILVFAAMGSAFAADNTPITAEILKEQCAGLADQLGYQSFQVNYTNFYGIAATTTTSFKIVSPGDDCVFNGADIFLKLTRTGGAAYVVDLVFRGAGDGTTTLILKSATSTCSQVVPNAWVESYENAGFVLQESQKASIRNVALQEVCPKTIDQLKAQVTAAMN